MCTGEGMCAGKGITAADRCRAYGELSCRAWGAGRRKKSAPLKSVGAHMVSRIEGHAAQPQAVRAGHVLLKECY